MKTTFNYVDIDADKATEMLKTQAHNRHVSAYTVERYAADMRAGRWRDTGDTVKIDLRGRLVDGQHRLRAVVAAGVTVRLAVLHGVDPRAMLAVDVGKRRSYGDILALRGIAHATVVAGIVRWVWLYLSGMAGMNITVSHGEADAVLHKFPDILTAAKTARSLRGDVASLLPPSVVGFLLWAYGRAHDEAGTAAVTDLIRATNLVETDPLRLLRSRLENDLLAQRKTPILTKLALTVKAINLRLAGATAKCLKWSRFGDHREDFPTIDGLNETWNSWRNRLPNRNGDETV